MSNQPDNNDDNNDNDNIYNNKNYDDDNNGDDNDDYNDNDDNDNYCDNGNDDDNDDDNNDNNNDDNDNKSHESITNCYIIITTKRSVTTLSAHSWNRHKGLFWYKDAALPHYGDVIMSTIASQITNLTIVYSIVYSDVDQRKHQSSASLAFVRGIHRAPVNSPHKWPVTRKMFPFDDVIMSLAILIIKTRGMFA